MLMPKGEVQSLGVLEKGEDSKYRILLSNVSRGLAQKLELYLGIPLEVAFRKMKYLKSLKQLRYLWGAAYTQIVNFLSRTDSGNYTKDEVHSYNTQWVLNKGNTGVCVVFTELEFDRFLSDYSKLFETKGKDKANTIAKKFARKLHCPVKASDIMGKRVVTVEDVTRVSKLTVQEFNAYKTALQEYWAKLGCDIPDPPSRDNYERLYQIEDE